MATLTWSGLRTFARLWPWFLKRNFRRVAISLVRSFGFCASVWNCWHRSSIAAPTASVSDVQWIVVIGMLQRYASHLGKRSRCSVYLPIQSVQSTVCDAEVTKQGHIKTTLVMHAQLPIILIVEGQASTSSVVASNRPNCQFITSL